jgi:hypothetical protein
MNLDHEAISTIVVVKLYLVTTPKQCYESKNTLFYVQTMNSSYWKIVNGLSLEVVVSKQLWIGPNH